MFCLICCVIDTKNTLFPASVVHIYSDNAFFERIMTYNGLRNIKIKLAAISAVKIQPAKTIVPSTRMPGGIIVS